MSKSVWKNFPENKPLKSGLYQVEYDCANHHWYQCWYWKWNEDAWVEENLRDQRINLEHMTNIRFKPWNDEQTVGSKVELTLKEAEELAVTLFVYHKVCQRFFAGINEIYLNDATKVRHNLDKKLVKAEYSDVAE